MTLRHVLFIVLGTIITMAWLYAVRWLMGVGVRLMMGARGRLSLDTDDDG